MRSLSRAIVIAGVATLGLAGEAPTLMAQSAPALVYPPSDPAKDISAAMAAAAKDGKHVLLDLAPIGARTAASSAACSKIRLSRRLPRRISISCASTSAAVTRTVTSP